MNDREFISQMAQFSTLEQMSSMNTTIQNLNRSARLGEAYALLGKRVEASNPVTGKSIRGTVSSLFYKNDEIKLKVDNNVIGLKDIHAVYPPKVEPGKNMGLNQNPYQKQSMVYSDKN